MVVNTRKVSVTSSQFNGRQHQGAGAIGGGTRLLDIYINIEVFSVRVLMNDDTKEKVNTCKTRCEYVGYSHARHLIINTLFLCSSRVSEKVPRLVRLDYIPFTLTAPLSTFRDPLNTFVTQLTHL